MRRTCLSVDRCGTLSRALVVVVLLGVAVHVAGAAAPAQGLLQLQPGDRVVSSGKRSVNVSSGARLTPPTGESVSLTSVGAGLRRKRVLGLWFDVYVAQLFAESSAATRIRQEPQHLLPALSDSPVVVMCLTFVRDVRGDQIADALVESLAAGGLSADSGTDLEQLKTVVARAGSIRSGSRVVLVLQSRTGRPDLLVFESPRGVESIEGRAGFKRDVLSAWFGTAADVDPGLAQLKTQILTGPAR